MKRIAFFLGVILFLTVPRISLGSQPVEVLHQAVDKAIQILEAPSLSSDLERSSRLEELWDLAREVFDFQEFARRSLGSNWRRFTVEERVEFTAAFADFLKRIYLPRAVGEYDGQKVHFMEEIILNENNALVKVQILHKDIKIPFEVHMLKRDSRWKVYDVLFLGISALKNYRAQFQSLLRKESPAEVIERLKQK